MEKNDFKTIGKLGNHGFMEMIYSISTCANTNSDAVLLDLPFGRRKVDNHKLMLTGRYKVVNDRLLAQVKVCQWIFFPSIVFILPPGLFYIPRKFLLIQRVFNVEHLKLPLK